MKLLPGAHAFCDLETLMTTCLRRTTLTCPGTHACPTVNCGEAQASPALRDAMRARTGVPPFRTSHMKPCTSKESVLANVYKPLPGKSNLDIGLVSKPQKCE